MRKKVLAVPYLAETPRMKSRDSDARVLPILTVVRG